MNLLQNKLTQRGLIHSWLIFLAIAAYKFSIPSCYTQKFYVGPK